MKVKKYSKKEVVRVLIISLAAMLGACQQPYQSIPSNPSGSFSVKYLQLQKGESEDLIRAVLVGPDTAIELRLPMPCSLRVGDVCYWDDATTSLRFERAYVKIEQRAEALNP